MPPPRERRRRGGKEENGDAAVEAPKATEDQKDDKNKKGGGRQPRKPRGKNNNSHNEKDEGKAAAAAATKEPPFHASLQEDVKKKMQDKGLELGKRTTVDVAVGDVRIKLGQGGYAGCALASATVGEGTYTCDEKGTVNFKWERSLEYKEKAWKKGDPSGLIATISLADGKSFYSFMWSFLWNQYQHERKVKLG